MRVFCAAIDCIHYSSSSLCNCREWSRVKAQGCDELSDDINELSEGKIEVCPCFAPHPPESEDEV